MDILASLFLPDIFDSRKVHFKSLKKAVCPQGILRLFCKSEQVDQPFYLLVDFKKSTPGDQESLSGLLKTAFEEHTLFRIISKKKVFLQLKNFTLDKKGITPPLSPGPYLLLPFSLEQENIFLEALLLIPRSVTEQINLLLDLSADEEKPRLSPEYLDTLRKTIYQRTASPPENLAVLFTSLPDPTLQLVLNRILHLNIANTDMLATYIFLLDERGDRLVDNLSSSVREQVFSRLRSQRLHATKRWTNQVKYIINRNIFKALDELGIKVGSLKVLSTLRFTYLLSRVERELEHKSLVNWLLFLEKEHKMQEFLTRCPRKILTGAFSFFLVPGSPEYEELTSLLSGYISRSGVKMLTEDALSAANGKIGTKEERISRLLMCFREIKDMYYQPLVIRWVQEGLFEEKCRELFKGKENSYALDFIVDQLGFAKVVYALKGTDPAWLEKILKGVLKTLYEDTVKGRIRFIKYGDYKTAECRIDFLKTLLILTDQGIV